MLISIHVVDLSLSGNKKSYNHTIGGVFVVASPFLQRYFKEPDQKKLPFLTPNPYENNH